MACSSEDQENLEDSSMATPPLPPIQETHSPERAQEMLDSLGEVENYYEVADGFNQNAQVIVLASPGGPNTFLNTSYFSSFHFLFTVVYVRQTQALPTGETDGLDSGLLDGSRVVSLEEARSAALKSAAILHKVAAHFKQQGKAVYLLTHSFGSFVAPYALVHYGNNFDKMLLEAGRLDMPPAVVDAYRYHCAGGFSFDDEGRESFTRARCNDVKQMEDFDEREEFSAFRSAARLQAAVGGPRYLELLQGMNLENLVYVYGTRDTAVGRLAQREVNFLEQSGARVIALDEGHILVDPGPFAHVPDVTDLLGEDLNSQIHDFFIAPLPSQYDLLEMPATDEMAYYLGQADGPEEDDTKFDVGIIFENHSQKQVSYKLDALFGDGPFSLFQTDVFRGHEDKFSRSVWSSESKPRRPIFLDFLERINKRIRGH